MKQRSYPARNLNAGSDLDLLGQAIRGMILVGWVNCASGHGPIMVSNLPGESVPTSVKLWRGAWMVSGIVGIGIVLYLVLFPPRTTASAHVPPAIGSVAPKRAVELHTDGTILIAMDATFASRIGTTSLKTQRITDPLLTVSGIVVARVLPGQEELSDRWHFDTPELGMAYASWLKSNSEIVFLRDQLVKTKELVTVETAFLDSQLKRLEASAKTGVIPEKDLLSARADLLKAQIQGQKDIFTAQVRLARCQKTGGSRWNANCPSTALNPRFLAVVWNIWCWSPPMFPKPKISQVHGRASVPGAVLRLS